MQKNKTIYLFFNMFYLLCLFLTLQFHFEAKANSSTSKKAVNPTIKMNSTSKPQEIPSKPASKATKTTVKLNHSKKRQKPKIFYVFVPETLPFIRKVNIFQELRRVLSPVEGSNNKSILRNSKNWIMVRNKMKNNRWRLRKFRKKSPHSRIILQQIRADFRRLHDNAIKIRKRLFFKLKKECFGQGEKEIAPTLLLICAYFSKKEEQDRWDADFEQFEKEMVLYDSGKRVGEPSIPKRSFLKTLSLLQRFSRSFQKHSQLDQVLFLQAQLLRLMKQIKKSEIILKKLIHRFPKSVHLSESYFLLAERSFEEGEKIVGIKYYKKMLALSIDHLHDKALYKLAWSYYFRGDFEASVKAFFQLIDHCERVGVTNTRKYLYDEAIQFIATTWISELDWKAKKIQRYMQKQRKKKTSNRTLLLALIKVSHRDNKQADRRLLCVFFKTLYPKTLALTQCRSN